MEASTATLQSAAKKVDAPRGNVLLSSDARLLAMITLGGLLGYVGMGVALYLLVVARI